MSSGVTGKVDDVAEVEVALAVEVAADDDHLRRQPARRAKLLAIGGTCARDVWREAPRRPWHGPRTAVFRRAAALFALRPDTVATSPTVEFGMRWSTVLAQLCQHSGP